MQALKLPPGAVWAMTESSSPRAIADGNGASANRRPKAISSRISASLISSKPSSTTGPTPQQPTQQIAGDDQNPDCHECQSMEL